ncbi:MAG: ECF-type sigma factor, partial [Planctomycetota bacterium]
MKNVTKMLSQIEQGDPAAAEQLLPLVYDDLRRLAAKKLAYEKAGLTLQATELVHEGYMRLVGPSGNRCFANRRHFYAAASEAMRRILIDRARRKQACKHGGDWHRLAVSPDVVGVSEDPKLLISLRELLKELT